MGRWMVNGGWWVYYNSGVGGADSDAPLTFVSSAYDQAGRAASHRMTPQAAAERMAVLHDLAAAVLLLPAVWY